MKTLTFKAEGCSESPTKTVVRSRGFEMVLDEPDSFGGTDDGPTPFEFLFGALAGCLNIVGHMVAKDMGFELQGITFELAGDFDPSRFQGKETSERAGYQEVRVTVTPDADTDGQTLERWLQTVEERCPVSDNLRSPTPLKLSVHSEVE